MEITNKRLTKSPLILHLVADAVSVGAGGVTVTQNQIAYWNLEETKRANQVREGETHRTNSENESIKRATNLLTKERDHAQFNRWRVQNKVDQTNARTNQFAAGAKLAGSALSALL